VQAVALLLVLVGIPAHADDPAPTTFEDLAAAAAECTPTAVEAMLAAAAAAPPREVADALFSVARACETRAGDPARALALYERILRDHPDERVAIGAQTRRDALVALIGTDGAAAERARRFAALRERAGLQPDAAVLAEADALAHEAWPGAGEVALWRAEALRRTGRLAPAAAAYDDVLARFPGTAWAARAAEGAAAVAIRRHRWDDAEARIARLPSAAGDDRAVRDGLVAELATERTRVRWYLAAWIGLVVAVLLLAASLAQAAGSLRAVGRALRPPVEVAYAAPVVGILLIAAATSHAEIGPAIALISGGGLVIAWLSGAGLAAARRRGTLERWRIAAHVAVTLLGVAALVYVAIMRNGLLEMIVETVRFGPDS
jgi:tetratricopeptide (TPR) repeat protein